MTESYSVLMSVYAAENPANLRLAMQSMWNQSIPPSEFVLVCDGPLSDGLEGVVSEMLEEHPDTLRVVRFDENGGLGRALQFGLSACRYEVVARMDSDDISRPNRCELLLDTMGKRGLDLVGGAIEEFERNPGDLGSIRRPPLGQDDIERYARRRNPFNHMTVIFRRYAVEAVGGYESFPLLEDYWLWVRMLASGARVGNVSDVVVDVRAGFGMHARRSGVAYYKSQRELFHRMHDIGFVTRGQAFRAIAERAFSAILPTKARGFAYSALLRTKSDRQSCGVIDSCE